MYADIAAAQVDEVRALRETAADHPVIETLTRAARVILGAGDSIPMRISPTSVAIRCPR